jgi:hypothetical protein
MEVNVLAVCNVLSAYLCDPSAARRFIGFTDVIPRRRGEPQRYAEKTFEAKPWLEVSLYCSPIKVLYYQRAILPKENLPKAA